MSITTQTSLISGARELTGTGIQTSSLRVTGLRDVSKDVQTSSARISSLRSTERDLTTLTSILSALIDLTPSTDTSSGLVTPNIVSV